MPDELPVENDGAPEATQDTQPTVDWEKRYTDTHAEYNRLNEQFRRFESDEDAVLEFIREKHPHLVADEESEEQEPEEFDANDDPYEPRIAAIERAEQDRAQREFEQARMNDWAGWEEHVKEQAEQAGIELKARDIKALRVDCICQDAFPVPADKANKVLEQYIAEYFAEPVDTKKRKPSTVLPGGTAADEAPPDWSKMTRSEQDEYMVARARALESQT